MSDAVLTVDRFLPLDGLFGTDKYEGFIREGAATGASPPPHMLQVEQTATASELAQRNELKALWWIDAIRSEVPWSTLSDRLSALANLDDNWNSYGAPAPNQVARASARAILDSAREKALRPTAIVPSVEGGVVISFETGQRHADIESLNDGCVLAMTSEPPRDPHVWPVRNDSKDTEAALEEIQAFMGQ